MLNDLLPGSLLLGGVIAIAALSVLLVLVRRIARRSRTLPDIPSLWHGRDYACPQCGAAMQPGWVLLGKGAIWSDRARGKPGAFANIGQALPNTISLNLRPAVNMAWRCAGCRLLLIDHDKLVR